MRWTIWTWNLSDLFYLLKFWIISLSISCLDLSIQLSLIIEDNLSIAMFIRQIFRLYNIINRVDLSFCDFDIQAWNHMCWLPEATTETTVTKIQKQISNLYSKEISTMFWGFITKGDNNCKGNIRKAFATNVNLQSRQEAKFMNYSSSTLNCST